MLQSNLHNTEVNGAKNVWATQHLSRDGFDWGLKAY